MPSQTVDRVRAAEERAARRLAEKREGLEPAALRKLRKRLRRAQRKRRRLETAAQRHAAKPAAAEASADKDQGKATTA